jgi:S1-C subfamily serine protease
VKFPEQLPLANLEISRLSPGAPVPLTIRRGAETLTVTLTPTTRDLAEAPSEEIKGWGVTASAITPAMALERRHPDTRGALITSITGGGPAATAEPALESNDVIVAIAGKPVTNLADLRARTEALLAARKPGQTETAPTLVEVRRKSERVLSVVTLNQQNQEDTSVEVAKAWLPVSTQVVTRALREALGLPASVTGGVRVTQVYPGTAAETAGLKVGDVITKVDDMDIEASQAEDTQVFSGMIRQYKIGTAAKLTVLRAGQPTTISVKLPQAPKQERELARYRDPNFGLSVRSLSYQDRTKNSVAASENGALVVEVSKGSWAALANLQEGDVIRSINGAPVSSMEAARDALQNLEKTRPKQVVFFVGRGVNTLFVEAQTDWSLSTPTPGGTVAAAGAAASPAR